MQTKQASPHPVRPLQISIFGRMLIVFSIVYTVFFALGYAWLYNFSATIVTENLASMPNVPNDIDPGVISSHLREHIAAVALPAYLVTFGLIFVVVLIVSYRATRPLNRLTVFAQGVAAGDYAEPPGKGPLAMLGRDEIDVLTDVFAVMVTQVRAREETLRAEVQQLQIVIDNKRKTEQVDEIADSDFFLKLKVRAKEIRAKRPDSEATRTEPPAAQPGIAPAP